MIHYDAGVIQRFASKLYAQADRIVVFYVIVFGLAGAAAGYAANSRRDKAAYVIGGAILLGAIGFVIGQARAFLLRLQAQVALCQVEIERNTREVNVGTASTS